MRQLRNKKCQNCGIGDARLISRESKEYHCSRCGGTSYA